MKLTYTKTVHLLSKVGIVLAGAIIAVTMVSCGSANPAAECLTTSLCAGNADCASDHRCNLELEKPVCQKLYCGSNGSLCSEDALCEGKSCKGGFCACEPACGSMECGVDPVCGVSCGTCNGGECVDGTCVGDNPDGIIVRDIIDDENEPYDTIGSDFGWQDTVVTPDSHDHDLVMNDSGEDSIEEDARQDILIDGDVCVAECGDRECGFEPVCGNFCGACSGDKECSAAGICETTCNDDCYDWECGNNDCGESCGVCADGYQCTQLRTCQKIVCLPEIRCGNLDCGGSGCFDNDGDEIQCGTCTGGEVCNESVQKCFPACTFPAGLPDQWDKTGVINWLHIPATADDKTDCFDYTGDGTGDCGLTGLASQLNPVLTDMMDAGNTAIMFEFADVTNFTTTGSFTLNGLFGVPVEPPTLSGEMFVDQSSYDHDTCMPMIFFEESRIVGGDLSAGPGIFRLSIPLATDYAIVLPLIDAQVKAELFEQSNGVEATDGILSGVLTKAELTAILDGLDAECAKDPQPESIRDICPYLGVARGAMAMLFDLHQVGDGSYIAKDGENPGDASSVCFQFMLAPATITGYTPAP